MVLMVSTMPFSDVVRLAICDFLMVWGYMAARGPLVKPSLCAGPGTAHVTLRTGGASGLGRGVPIGTASITTKACAQG